MAPVASMFIMVLLLVIGAIVFTVVAVFVLLMRGIARTVKGQRRRVLAPLARTAEPVLYCTAVRCHAGNPPRARFCRRCGQRLRDAADQVIRSRAA